MKKRHPLSEENAIIVRVANFDVFDTWPHSEDHLRFKTCGSLFLVKVETILGLYDAITQSFVKSIRPLIPTWSIQIKLGSPWENLFDAIHQTGSVAFPMI